MAQPSTKPRFLSRLLGTPTPDPAFKSPRAIAIFVLLVIAGLAGDLLSKHYVFQSMLSSPQVRKELEIMRPYVVGNLTSKQVLHSLPPQPVGRWLQWRLSLNDGIVFGLEMPRSIVAAASVVAILLTTGLFSLSSRRAWVMHAALALILVGALGNLYDRLFSSVQIPLDSLEPIRYHVRDFIDLTRIRIGGIYYKWIFNVADIFLVIGVVLLMAHQWRTQKKSQP